VLVTGDRALRKEANAMTFVGCDLQTRMRQVAVLDTDCVNLQRDSFFPIRCSAAAASVLGSASAS
jgi:hypothetical protein